MELKELREKSDQLQAVRAEIDKLDEAHEMVTAPLKQQKEQLQQELIQGFTELDLASIKASSGEIVTKAIRKSVAIIDPYRADVWARENGLVKVDTKLVEQWYKDGKELPAAFQARETEYIKLTKPKAANTVKEGEPQESTNE